METVKTLDRHLYAGAEIQEVYNEITKTSTKDFLAFDKVSCFFTFDVCIPLRYRKFPVANSFITANLLAVLLKKVPSNFNTG